eukprot:GFUD01016584.1.p1 GENE.GFUD01016584.1~~GFUD01016584.1.p1  ORF type:complete len:510 (+),score=191.20 GFUD01016584.1:123-1652(+)
MEMHQHQEPKKRRSSSTVDLREMNKLHESMVKQMTDTDDYETEKVSRRVSHAASYSSVHRAEELTPVTRTVRSAVGHSAELILKDCNNTLLTFIDKARILAEAKEVKTSLPNSLKEKISIEMDVTNAFVDEIAKLKMKIDETKKSNQARSHDLGKLKEENVEISKRHQQNQRALQERETELHSLETEELELETKIGSANMRLKERILQLEAEIVKFQATLKEVSASFGGIEESKVADNFASPEEEFEMKKSLIGKMSEQKSQEEKAIIIKIKNEYLEKMKAALHKVRLEYQQDYQKFIQKIETESAEIMQFFEALIQARMHKNAAAMNYSSLLELERMRNYQGRIDQLETDRDRLEGIIRMAEGNIGNLALEYKDQLADLDQKLEALKFKLRDLFTEFSSFAKWKYGHSHEITIYSRLLQYEQGRLEENKPPMQVSVEEKTERSVRSVAVVLGRDGQTVDLGHKKEKKPRRESGYKSSGDKTPEGTLDRGLTLGPSNRDSFLADLENSV